MRKTSQDGGDCTSITSGVESEMKKPIVGLLKTKKSSIKRKVQNFSHDSDDAVIEPLLQKDKDKSEIPNQSAKHLLSKAKTESLSEVINDKDKLLPGKKNEKSLTSAPSAVAGTSSLINGTKESNFGKSYENSAFTIHNHMNTNIFSSLDGGKSNALPKTQILVEIDGGKQSGYNSSPLIFTTAKIHSDCKTKQMEPVQVTRVPILSTIEGSVIKSGNIRDNNTLLSGEPNKNDALNAIYAKSGTIDPKVVDEQQHAKAIPACNLPVSGIPTKLPESNENNDQNALSQHFLSSFNSTNDVPRSVITVDVNITLPAKTIKSETGVTGNTLIKTLDQGDIDKNKQASKSAIIKDSFMSNGNKVDMNKNIQSSCTLSPAQASSHIVVLDKKVSTDISSTKHLQRQKQAIVEDSNKDAAGSYESIKSPKDVIVSSHQKTQQAFGDSKSVFDVNRSSNKFNNITTISNVTSKPATKLAAVRAIASTTSMIIKPTTATSPFKTEMTATVPSALTSSSCKPLEILNPLIKTTLTAASISLVNKPLATTVSLLARTTASLSMSTKTSSIKPVTPAILTSNPKKITEKIETTPLSTTSVATKSSATTAISTAKPTVTTTSIISTAKPTVLTATVTSTTKPIVITSSSNQAVPSVTMTGSTMKPVISSTVSTIKSTIASQTITTTLPSTPKPVLTTVKAPSINKTSTTLVASTNTSSIARTLSTGYPATTPPVTKSSSIVKPEVINSSATSNKPVAHEISNQSTLLKSSKVPVSKSSTGSLTHSASVISSKSPVASANTPTTTTNSIKQPSVKSSTSKLNSSTAPKFR